MFQMKKQTHNDLVHTMDHYPYHLSSSFQHSQNEPHIHEETNSEMSEKLDFQPILAPG